MSLALNDNWQKAVRFIPNGCQTLSKRPATYCRGSYPKLLVSGHGCEVIDDEGNKYIDYISSLGAILKGYSDQAVDDAVKQSISDGQVLLSLSHPKEAELAEKICSLFKQDKVKFFKTGSEATTAAVKVARAFTGRNTILKCGYNGWHDWALIRSSRTDGIPIRMMDYTGTFNYNDMSSVESAFRRHGPIAAIILEPIIYDEPQSNFLSRLCDFARSQGAIVIFDEIVTGFRFGMSGAASIFNVIPDISCFGKALGNGYPIAGIVGQERIMNVFEYDTFMASGTFSGDLIGISAALAVLETFDAKKLWANGMALKMGFNKICQTIGLDQLRDKNDIGIDVSCIGMAPRTKFEFPTIEHRALFWQECVRRGILFGYTNFVTMAHGPSVIASTLKACYESLDILKKNWGNPGAKVIGELPKVVL